MSLLSRLYSGNPGFDFRRVWVKALTISVVLIVLCLASLALRGLNLGIDFRGGGVWEVRTPDLSIEATRDALRPSGHDNARIQVVTEAGVRIIRVQLDIEPVDETEVDETAETAEPVAPTAADPSAEIRSQNLADDARVIAEALAEAAGVPSSEVSINTVGPTWGEEISGAAQRALIFFFIAIAAYISIRLEWKMAVGALVAVAHDIVISVGLYSLFQFTVTPATVIAFLTILGYSLYDTVVVFDKVKESEHLVGTTNKMTYTDMANYATNEVFMRSVNTTITSLLPIFSILVVGSWWLGATTLQEFGLALFIGLGVGAYSSLFVAIPVVTWLKEREPELAEINRRLGGSRAAPVMSNDVADMASAKRRTAADDRRELANAGARPAATLPAPRVTPTISHPPRPRKKGKKR